MQPFMLLNLEVGEVYDDFCSLSLVLIGNLVSENDQSWLKFDVTRFFLFRPKSCYNISLYRRFSSVFGSFMPFLRSRLLNTIRKNKIGLLSWCCQFSVFNRLLS